MENNNLKHFRERERETARENKVPETNYISIGYVDIKQPDDMVKL